MLTSWLRVVIGSECEVRPMMQRLPGMEPCAVLDVVLDVALTQCLRRCAYTMYSGIHGDADTQKCL